MGDGRDWPGWSSGTQARHNLQGKFLFELSHVGVGLTFVTLNNWDITSNMTSVLVCLCLLLVKHAVCNSNESFIPNETIQGVI